MVPGRARVGSAASTAARTGALKVSGWFFFGYQPSDRRF